DAKDQQRRAGGHRDRKQSRQPAGDRTRADDVVDGDLQRNRNQQRQRRGEQAEKKYRRQMKTIAAGLPEQPPVDRQRAVAPSSHQSSPAPSRFRLETTADIAAAQS